jgi:hypothetical protein
MVPHLYDLPTGDAEACRSRVRTLLLGDSFLYKEVSVGDGSLKAWFVREELCKLLWSHMFRTDKCIGKNKYLQAYFKPLRWTTILFACTTLRCALMDFEDTGCKGEHVADFSQNVFSGGCHPHDTCRGADANDRLLQEVSRDV